MPQKIDELYYDLKLRTRDFERRVQLSQKRFRQLGESAGAAGAAVSGAGAKVKRTGEQIEKAGKSAKQSTGLFAKMGKALLGMATAVVGIQSIIRALRHMVTVTTALDKAMGQVSTLVDTSTVSMKQLTNQVQELTSKIPKNADDLGMGLYQVLSSGVSDTADAMIVLERSASLAASGLVSTFESVDAVTTVMNAYNVSAEDAGKVTDNFFTTVKQGKVTVGGLAQSIGTAATSASLAGVGMDDLGAAIATMTKLGIDANTTTTSLNRLFLGVVDAQQQTKDAAKAMGLEWSVAGLKAKGLAGFLNEVAVATGGDIEKLTALGLDLRAARSLFILAGTGADQFRQIQDEFANSTGATDEALQKVNQTLAAQAQLLKNRFSTILEDLGQRILPGVLKGLELFSRMFLSSFERGIEAMRRAGAEAERIQALLDQKAELDLQVDRRRIIKELETLEGGNFDLSWTVDVELAMKVAGEKVERDLKKAQDELEKLQQFQIEHPLQAFVDRGPGFRRLSQAIQRQEIFVDQLTEQRTLMLEFEGINAGLEAIERRKAEAADETAEATRKGAEALQWQYEELERVAEGYGLVFDAAEELRRFQQNKERIESEGVRGGTMTNAAGQQIADAGTFRTGVEIAQDLKNKRDQMEAEIAAAAAQMEELHIRLGIKTKPLTEAEKKAIQDEMDKLLKKQLETLERQLEPVWTLSPRLEMDPETGETLATWVQEGMSVAEIEAAVEAAGDKALATIENWKTQIGLDASAIFDEPLPAQELKLDLTFEEERVERTAREMSEELKRILLDVTSDGIEIDGVKVDVNELLLDSPIDFVTPEGLLNLERFKTQLAEGNDEQKEAAERLDDMQDRYKALREALAKLYTAQVKYNKVLKDPKASPAQVAAAMADLTDATQQYGDAVRDAGDAAEKAANKTNLIADVASNFASAARGVLDLAQSFDVLTEKQEQALEAAINLGESIAKIASGKIDPGTIIQGIGAAVSLVRSLGGPTEEEKDANRKLILELALLRDEVRNLADVMQIGANLTREQITVAKETADLLIPIFASNRPTHDNPLSPRRDLTEREEEMRQLNFRMLQDRQDLLLDLKKLEEVSGVEGIVDAVLAGDIDKFEWLMNLAGSAVDELNAKLGMFGNNLQGQMAAFQLVIDQFDIEPAIEQFRKFKEIVIDKFAPEIGKALDGFDLDTAEGRQAASDYIASLAEGIALGGGVTQEVQDMFPGLTSAEIIAILSSIDGFLDNLDGEMGADQADETQSFTRNVQITEASASRLLAMQATQVTRLEQLVALAAERNMLLGSDNPQLQALLENLAISRNVPDVQTEPPTRPLEPDVQTEPPTRDVSVDVQVEETQVSVEVPETETPDPVVVEMKPFELPVPVVIVEPPTIVPLALEGMAMDAGGATEVAETTVNNIELTVNAPVTVTAVVTEQEVEEIGVRIADSTITMLDRALLDRNLRNQRANGRV